MNTVASDRIRQGQVFSGTGAAGLGASYAPGKQFIGGAAAYWSFWVTIDLRGGATSVTLKLENTYDGTNWATVGTRRNDVSPTVENGEHTFSSSGTYLLTCERSTRAYDAAGPDGSGNYGGLRFSAKAAGAPAAGDTCAIVGACW